MNESKPNKIIKMVSLFNNDNLQMAITALVIIRTEHEKNKLLNNNTASLKHYCNWAETLKKILLRKLTLEEHEWVNEVIIGGDPLLLESIQSQATHNIKDLCEEPRWLGVQKLLVTIMMSIFSDDLATISYDSRLRSLLKSLAQALLEGDSSRKSTSAVISLAEVEVICKIK